MRFESAKNSGKSLTPYYVESVVSGREEATRSTRRDRGRRRPLSLGASFLSSVPRSLYVGLEPTPGKMILFMGSYCFHSCPAQDEDIPPSLFSLSPDGDPGRGGCLARAAPPEPAPGGSPRARRSRPDARRGARAWTTEWPASAPPEGGTAIRRVTRGVMRLLRATA